jgi:hypothetical protein
VCWKPCLSCWSFHLLREEFLSAPIHSPPLWFTVSVLSEGDDTVVVVDTSDEEDDEETLQDRFQLRSRSSRPGLPHIPLVQDLPASLEASLPAPPRKPHNVARKRVAKKLKVTETTSQEVSHLDEGSRVLMSRGCVLTTKFPCLQEMPPSEPVEQGDEGDWDTVGEAAGGSRSPAPTVEELLAQMARQPPITQGSTESAAAATEEAAATEAQEEAPAEAGLVDIASILGAPTMTVVRSSL